MRVFGREGKNDVSVPDLKISMILLLWERQTHVMHVQLHLINWL